MALAEPQAPVSSPRTSVPGPGDRGVEHSTIRSIVIGIMLAMFLSALEQTIVGPALPTIGRVLGRYRKPLVGGDGLSAQRHGGDAAVRQALRHLRPPHGHARFGRHLRRRLGCLRACAHHVDADPRPRAAGHRRRRHPSDRTDHHRGPDVAARAPALAGLLRHHIHDCEYGSVRCSAASSPITCTGR